MIRPLALLIAALTLGALATPADAQTTVRDSVRMNIYVFHNAGRTEAGNGFCGAGVFASWPNVLQSIRDDRDYGYSDYTLVATEGMYVKRGWGEYREWPPGSPMLGHNPRIDGSAYNFNPDHPIPDCSSTVQTAERIVGGAWMLDGGRPYRITEWYAVYGVPDGTPVALFEWKQADGFAVDFDGFEDDLSLSREVDASAPSGKRPVVAYAWDFGDGQTGSGAEPTHSYAEAGEYAVTLTVTDDDGEENSRTDSVTVSATRLTVSVLADVDEAVVGDTIEVTAIVHNTGTETVYDLEVPRLFTPVPRIPEDQIIADHYIRDASVLPVELAAGESAEERRDELAPGVSIEVRRTYVVERAFRHEFLNGDPHIWFEAPVQWQTIAALAVDGAGDAVPVVNACETTTCPDRTLIEVKQLSAAIETTTALGKDPSASTTVFSGLAVGPRPVFDGVTVDHFIRDNDGSGFGPESRCRTGCIDWEATITDPETGVPQAGLKLDISHPPISGPGVVTPNQGGGFLCERRSANPTCGQKITLTTDEEGRVRGNLAVPGVISTTPVTLTLASAANQPAPYNGVVVQGTQNITIEPNPLYSGSIPIDSQQAEDLGYAAAVRVGFQRADLPNKLCATVQKAMDTASKRAFTFSNELPKEFIDEVCKNVNAASLAELLSLGQEAPKIAFMSWFFESTGLPDLGLAVTTFKKTPYFFDVSSQLVDELSASIVGRLDSNGELQAGDAPFRLYEVSHLKRNGERQEALYFSLWDRSVLVSKDYDAGLWLIERYERSTLPPTTLGSPAPSGGTTLTTSSSASNATSARVRVARVRATSPDSLHANAIVVISPDDPDLAETVRILSVSGDATAGYVAELASPLAFSHPAGAALRVIGEGQDSPSVVYAVAPVDTVSIGDRVRLAWAVPQPVSEVDLEIARDAAFTDVLVARTVSGAERAHGSYDVDMADAGIRREAPYFWRARGRDRTGETTWTDPVEFFISSVVTDTDPTEVAPERLSLAVYPNPASDRATLVFELPDAQPVQVSVFDALGRRIAAPVDAHRAAGRHELAIRVSELPVGVYVARVATEAGSASQRFTVVR